jgi:hypothetical protein
MGVFHISLDSTLTGTLFLRGRSYLTFITPRTIVGSRRSIYSLVSGRLNRHGSALLQNYYYDHYYLPAILLKDHGSNQFEDHLEPILLTDSAKYQDKVPPQHASLRN